MHKSVTQHFGHYLSEYSKLTEKNPLKSNRLLMTQLISITTVSIKLQFQSVFQIIDTIKKLSNITTYK